MFRRYTLIACAGILALSFLLTGCDGDTDTQDPEQPGILVPVTIDPGQAAGRLDERYLGFAFDTVQFTEGFWWDWSPEGPQPEQTPDLESPKLRNLTSYLAPSRMRIGGTDSDAAYFCPEEGECDLPATYRGAYPGIFDRIDRFIEKHKEVYQDPLGRLERDLETS